MKTKYKILALFVVIILIVFLNFFIQKSTILKFSEEDKVKEEKEESSLETESFHYQLQDAKYSDLKNLDVDLLIVDDLNLKKSEILDLKNDSKMVLSYLSIGEAEDYRDYWQSNWRVGNPSFIDEENPDWEGNYKVKYWNVEWQNIILNRVEEIALKEYDGVYLDIIDAYEYYAFMSSIHSAKEMVNFVKKIRDKGRQINPDFLIVPQNAPELYQYEEYRWIIDGFGKEDTWYDDNEVQDNDEREFALKYLDRAIGDGKFVLAIDYPTQEDKICNFYKNCEEHKFSCTISNRDLNKREPIVCSK